MIFLSVALQLLNIHVCIPIGVLQMGLSELKSHKIDWFSIMNNALALENRKLLYELK